MRSRLSKQDPPRLRYAAPASYLKTFRVHPQKNSSLHFRVFVFSSVQEMRAYLDALDKDRGTYRRGSNSFTDGQFSSFKCQRFVGNKWRTDPCFGHMYLAMDRMIPEIVAHEAVHAMFAWLRRITLLGKNYRANVFSILIGVETAEDVGDPEEAACGVINKTVALVAQRLKLPWR